MNRNRRIRRKGPSRHRDGFRGSAYHSPMVTVITETGSPVGRLCVHCGLLSTLAGNPSQPEKALLGDKRRMAPNKSHQTRLHAEPIMGRKAFRKIERLYRKMEKRGDIHEDD